MSLSAAYECYVHYIGTTRVYVVVMADGSSSSAAVHTHWRSVPAEAAAGLVAAAAGASSLPLLLSLLIILGHSGGANWIHPVVSHQV